MTIGQIIIWLFIKLFTETLAAFSPKKINLKKKDSFNSKLELPIDIWECILRKLDNRESCEKFYEALPVSIQRHIQPSYHLKMDYFREIYLVFIQSVLIVFKDDDIHKIKDFGYQIMNAEFGKYNGEILVLLENDDIFYYHYDNDYYYDIILYDQSLFSERIRFFFNLSFYKDFLLLFVPVHNELYFQKYYGEKPEFTHLLHQTNIQGPKKFMTTISLKNPEMASFFYCRYNGEVKSELKLLNHNTLEEIYVNTQMKVRAFCFDEFGKFFFCDNNSVRTLDENNEAQHFLSIFQLGKIDKIMAYNNFLYYAIYFKYTKMSHIYVIDYENDFFDDEDVVKVMEFKGRCNYMKMHRFCRFFVYGKKEEFVYFDFAEKKIVRRIDLTGLKKEKEIMEKIDFGKDTSLGYDLLLEC